MLASVKQPSTWDKSKSYIESQYHLVPVSHHSSEFAAVANYFTGPESEINTIERVQNPFQYGKFLLFQLQKGGVQERTMFMPISQEKLTTALRHNCDFRRLNHQIDLFYNSPQQLPHGTTIIIILQTLTGYSCYDAGRYPQYVVTLNTHHFGIQ